MARTNSTEFDVFLAHNSQDKPQVEAIGKKLKERGLKPWLDKEQIPPGRWFQDVIQAAIPSAKSAAVFIGPKGLGKWQVLELRTFISQCVNKDIPVIPVLLPGVDRLPDNLLFLQELNWVRLGSVDDEEALDNLEWGVRGTHPKDSGTPAPASAKGKPKKQKSGGKIAKPPANAKAVNSSGNWLLLDGRFYQPEEVSRNADGTMVVKIASKDAADEAAIQPLDPAHTRSGRPVGFAYGNDGLLVTVKGAPSTSRDGGWVWTLTLAPERVEYGGGHSESSYHGPEGNFSAEEIVELRARRILLNNAPKETKKAPGWGILEAFISGKGHVPIPAEGCILQAVYSSLKGKPAAFTGAGQTGGDPGPERGRRGGARSGTELGAGQRGEGPRQVQGREGSEVRQR